MINKIKITTNSLRGLTEEEVQKSRKEHGQNLLTPPKKTSMWKLYAEKYQDPIIQILLVAAFISLVLAFIKGDFIETIGIILAIFLATTIGFYFERDAARKFNILTALGEEQPVKVRRNGKVCQIPRRDLVVGDIVLIETGDEVPADGHLAESVDLEIDESSLTGEPIVSKYSDESRNDTQATYPSYQVMRSSKVMGGRGTYIVTAVGDATEIGKVAHSSTEETNVKTPLNQQIDKLAQLINKIGISVSVAAFVIFLTHSIITNDAVWRDGDWLMKAEDVLKYFMMAVTLIVMAVPEGLPMAVTLSLALNMRRMLKSNNLVRKLHACETMGAVTVICTDKTGTLTQNKMTVVKVYCPDDTLFPQAIAMNTTAELNGTEGIGNPTEVALLQWLQQQDILYTELRNTGTILHQKPFSTETKSMETAVEIDGQQHVFLKGAPEIILSQCAIDDQERQEVEATLRDYQQQAMRTLAFACDGKFQAVVGISDPVRPDVPSAVENCKQAGIEVKIVTGDTSATAIEIARQIGIVEGAGEERYFITGAEFSRLSEEEAMERVKDLRVISRARPADKQRLVELLQKQGQVVAVTGDGTNDAPALHYAHVGLSLGSGTSVAKEASDITLLDDSFHSIVSAVMWGRSLYKNIQRFLFFQLIVNVTALLLVLGGSLIGTQMPLTVTQILWVNLIMDTFAALALASLPPSREVLQAKPRDSKDFIISPGMMKGILFWGGIFFVLMFALLIYCLYYDEDPGIQLHDLSMFFTTFVMLQFWNLFNAKCLGSKHSAFRYFFRNRGLLLVLLFILGGQWLIVTFGGDMFRTVPLSWKEWLQIIAATSIVLWIGELYRIWQRLRT